MKLTTRRMAKAMLLVAGSLSLLQSVQAASTFAYSNRDLVLLLRKTGIGASPNDLQINIGQASNYYGAAFGSSFVITNFTGAQISNVFSDFNDLSWTVGATVPAAGDSGDASVPTRTLWITAPRLDPSVKADPWQRQSATTQGGASSKIKSILDNAVFYSGTIGSNALNNTPKVVVVPVGGGHEFGAFMGSFGNYLNTFNGNVENTTPSDFTTAGLPSRSDLYELRPGTGSGTYLGYFELSATGTVTFVAPSFPAPTLSIQRTGTLDTISFPTTSGAAYTLYFTNSAGLTTATTNWPFVSTNVTGDGTVKSFQVNSSASERFYRATVH